MHIRIGNQSAFSASPLTRPFEYAAANGFDAFEWFPDKRESGEGWNEADISPETRAWIRETAHTMDILLSVHAPWQVNLLEPEGRDRLIESIELTKEIGASLLNVHLRTDAGVRAYAGTFAPFLSYLAESRIRLSIENTPLTGPDHFNELFSSLRELFPEHSNIVGMCLDLGHANLCEATRNDYLRFMDLLDPQVPVIHIHAHENYGDVDSHLPLFTGPAGTDSGGIKRFVERMVQRRFAGSIILEQWPEHPSLLNAARNSLLEIIEHALKIAGESPPATSPFEADVKKDLLVSPSEKKLPFESAGTFSSSEQLSEEDFVDLIARNEQRCKSWRHRLIFIHDMVTQETRQLGTDELVYLAIYLRFIGNGQIPASEDGSHHRPSEHARMARQIHERLAKITAPDNAFLMRKIYPYLPSFDSAFMRVEPLTRIRDIAHRNDIPKDLKQEIKHSLQNKLHRCAGPEDLETSSRLLERITAPNSDLSPAFIREFRQFHEELKEFFNARSLQEQLEALGKKVENRQARLINQFLASRERTNTLQGSIQNLEILTNLRASLTKLTCGNSSSEIQEMEMADIKLEEFLFVLLSQIINQIEAQKTTAWSLALQCLVLTVDNLRLSQFNERECRAVASELNAWRAGFDPRDREQLIRLKATVYRCSRLSELYSSRILALFPGRVEKLGRALGVSEQAIRVFSEADIRSHPVFQLSKLVALLTGTIRELADLPPWDTVAPGKITGRFVAVRRMDEIRTASEEPIIALLEKAEGDEEIPPHVTGIVVLHEIPHLSHLAVRARQAKVVLAVTEDPRTIVKLKELAGRKLTLEAGFDKVIFEVTALSSSSKVESAGRATGPEVFTPIRVLLSDDPVLLSLNQASVETAGAKATAARKLEEMSKHDGAGFEVPSGLVIPFGVMEESLKSKPSLEHEYRKLIKGLGGLSNDEFTQSLEKLRLLIDQLNVPREIIQQVMKSFPREAPLMVRSSSNLEDLPGFSGAGLYESVANVSLDEFADAVRSVWSSLWSRRAALSRNNAAVPHERAQMAVLIQEMIVPELSFILHTSNPVSGAPDEVYAELALGLGQTLASGETPGTPYRMICNKRTGGSVVLAFASFSSAIMPEHRPGSECSAQGIGYETIDYSKVRFSCDKPFRDLMGSRLAALGSFIETAFGRPQDIEGLVSKDGRIFVVQSRPQQGLNVVSEVGSSRHTILSNHHDTKDHRDE